MKFFRITFLVLALFCMPLFSLVFTPIPLQGILKSIYAPALFGVYSKDFGRLYCQLYGVATPSKNFQSDICEINPKTLKAMRHFAMNYTQNKIFSEQIYFLSYQNGWCFLQNGGNLFNEQIIKDGYGVVQYFDLTQEEVITKLETLESVAKNKRKGLWKEWAKEMECIKNTLREIAKEKQK